MKTLLVLCIVVCMFVAAYSRPNKRDTLLRGRSRSGGNTGLDGSVSQARNKRDTSLPRRGFGGGSSGGYGPSNGLDGSIVEVRNKRDTLRNDGRGGPSHIGDRGLDGSVSQVR